jgi:hypothetical protein
LCFYFLFKDKKAKRQKVTDGGQPIVAQQVESVVSYEQSYQQQQQQLNNIKPSCVDLNSANCYTLSPASFINCSSQQLTGCNVSPAARQCLQHAKSSPSYFEYRHPVEMSQHALFYQSSSSSSLSSSFQNGNQLTDSSNFPIVSQISQSSVTSLDYFNLNGSLYQHDLAIPAAAYNNLPSFSTFLN